jgi:hypothetical protein
MILVTGATGTVGREVVAQLLAAGEQVRGMTRNLSTAKLDARVEVVKGDFTSPDTLAKAVDGVERVFSLTFGPQTGTHERDLAALAKKAGVRHIVKLSAMGGDGETKNVIRKWHEQGEEAIKETGISWTVVRPGGFMSNALHWRETVRTKGKVFSNYGDGKLPCVHPRDIAAVAVRALTSNGHERKTLSALRYRNFRLFFFGQLISLTGTWMDITAEGWLVYKLTGSKLLLGVVGVAGSAPLLLFSIWGGWLADHYPKRTVIVFTQSVSMVLAFILSAIVWLGVVRPWHIVLIAFLFGVVLAFDMPSRQSFFIEMTSRNELANSRDNP